MAGIYLHVPYCRQKCHYCNFYSFASNQYRGEYVGAIQHELQNRKDYLDGAIINTVYFGGGTPSMLSSIEINAILQTIREYYPLAGDAEITLEANPDDLNEEKLSALSDTEINRLSIGVQSFFDDDLVYLNRVHDSTNAITSIERSLQHGFQNLTIDLIYGIPTLTDHKWEANLERFFSYQLPHLSSYALTVEPRTALYTLIGKGRMKPVDEHQSIRHFKTLLQKTAEQGYVHYEISNFAREGNYSRHNSIYWVGGHYLGVGPSAHSFNGTSRQWNVSNMKRYIEADTIEKRVKEKEILTEEMRYNEYVMTSLRTIWGCDTDHIANVFGEKKKSYFQENSASYIQQGLIRQEGSRYFLTGEGKLFADGIASALFI